MTPVSTTPAMPNRSGLLTRLALAAVIGALITVCVVMPAEYRKDPTGFGRLAGLLELTTPKVVPPEVTADSAPVGDADSSSFSHLFETPFRTDTIKIPIGPDGELEYKATLKAGKSMIYSWSVDKGAVYYDFHGEGADPETGRKYNEVQETTSANGEFTAPFDGKHGWYWLNVTGENIVVTLKLAGFYESHDYVR